MSKKPYKSPTPHREDYSDKNTKSNRQLLLDEINKDGESPKFSDAEIEDKVKQAIEDWEDPTSAFDEFDSLDDEFDSTDYNIYDTPTMDDSPSDFDAQSLTNDDEININPILDKTIEINDDIQYEYDPNRSYFFIYGPNSVGKTVIIGSIYEYLNTKRSLKGDKISNINGNTLPHEILGNQLLNEFIEKRLNNSFPKGTFSVQTEYPIPRHLNFKFSSANPKKPEFEFCFMDMSGEDLSKINFNSEKKLPPSIKTYIEDVPKENLCFFYVIDPTFLSADKIKQNQIFTAFIQMIDTYNHDDTPIMLLVSKWDAVQGYKDEAEYLENEFPSIWAATHQAGRNFTVGSFSIGEVIDKQIKKYDLSYAEKVFKWMYKTQTGKDLDDTVKNKPNNWLSRILEKYLS